MISGRLCGITTLAVIICLVLLTGHNARAQDHIVLISDFADQTLLAVADNGDWYSQAYDTSNWALRGNVFTDAGVSDPVTLVAFENQDWNGNLPTLLDANGDILEMDVSSGKWSFASNIPESSEHTPSGTFVDLAYYGATIVAVTDGGDWYSKAGTDQAWQFQSNIFATAGVVAVSKRSLGRLKAKY